MRYLLLLLIPALLLSGCGQKYASNKLGANDPFASTMVPSQFFTIDPDRDNIVEGSSGTTVAMQKDCFVDRWGRTVKGPVQVELSEALTMDKMLASNLTTSSDGKLLETGGMIYFKATADGKEVFVKKSKPLYIEIPTTNKKGGMLVYHGTRDKDGNMNWIDPKPIESYLTPVDITTLDFLPEGFARGVAEGMPLGGYKKVTKPFIDSLYYSFSSLARGQAEPEKRVDEMGPASPLNEPYYNPNSKIVNGAYTKESYNVSDSSDATSDTAVVRDDINEIDPARIKSLLDPKFNNTLIATHEFEQRLQYIFKTCNKDILEIYVNNLDKDLWRLDEMAVEKLGKDDMAEQFRKFAAQRLTNVKDAPEQAAAMQRYYQEQLASNTQQLKALYERSQALQAAKQQEEDSVRDEYRNLLWKREKYRMEKYRLTWTDNGWINVDTGIVPKQGPIKLEATVTTPLQYDHLHVYLVLTDIKSLYKMNEEKRGSYFAGRPDDHAILMYPNREALIVAVAYKDSVPYMAIKKFVTAKETHVNIQGVTRTTQADMEHVMNEIEKGNYSARPGEWRPGENEIAVSRKSEYAAENSMIVDLAYQRYFDAREDERQRFYREQHVMDHLRDIIYPCSACRGEGMAGGRDLFVAKCQVCHGIWSAQTGPALSQVTYRRDRQWLYSFTRNYKVLLNAGDPYAVNIVNYAPSEMSTFPELTDRELKELYDYLECEGGRHVFSK